MLSGRERYLTSRRLLSQLLACLLLVSIFSVAAPRTTATTPTAHAPIFINGNADFTAANGVTGGTGTSADPYVISYWDINLHQGGQWGDCGPDPSDCILVCSAPYCLGIQVQNTRAYFVIQNVSIHDGYPNSLDISFSNVTNGQVESSNLTSYSGISIINSGNVTVSGNNVAIPQYSLGAHSGYDDGPGLQIGSSSYVTISGNSFTVWREPDIRLTGDSNLVISNNNFVGSSSTNNSQALDMTNLVNSTIQNNQTSVSSWMEGTSVGTSCLAMFSQGTGITRQRKVSVSGPVPSSVPISLLQTTLSKEGPSTISNNVLGRASTECPLVNSWWSTVPTFKPATLASTALHLRTLSCSLSMEAQSRTATCTHLCLDFLPGTLTMSLFQATT